MTSAWEGSDQRGGARPEGTGSQEGQGQSAREEYFRHPRIAPPPVPTPARMGIENESRTRPSVHCNAAHSSQTETNQVSVDRRMDKDVARNRTEYCSAIKAEEIMPLSATQTDLETTTVSRVSQTQETHGSHVSLKKDTSELIHRTETDTPQQRNRLMATRGERGKGTLGAED